MSMEKRDDGGPAFPALVWDRDSLGEVVPREFIPGMSIRDYFIANAPAEPWPFYRVEMETPRPEAVYAESDGWKENPLNGKEIDAWDREKERRYWMRWPAFYADAMLAERKK